MNIANTQDQAAEDKQPKDKKAAEAKAEDPQAGVTLFASKRMRGYGEEEHSSSLWLITFTDIMALMLTFFVLLYAMSVPAEDEWDEITSGLNKEFNKYYSTEWYEGAVESINIDRIDYATALNLNYLNTIVTDLIASDDKLEDVALIPQSDNLIVSLPEDLLFESGQAEVSAEGKQALFSLGGALSRIRNRIEVIGHTDPRPIESQAYGFSSNWELSLARAASVAAILENVGYERPIILRGLSSARYDELPDSYSEEEKLSLSRRVDIVIMQDTGKSRQFLDIGEPPL